jgi:phosphinothricin acetyltransferase
VNESLAVRQASLDDLEAIRLIYNQGIEDRVATLDTETKSRAQIVQWWSEHDQLHAILVATESGKVIGWASLNLFSHRCAHSGIADLSVYVAREHRGRSVGSHLLSELKTEAAKAGFRKIVLHALDGNEGGKQLYRKMGFVQVGVFKQHGLIDGGYVDVVVMEHHLQ